MKTGHASKCLLIYFGLFFSPLNLADYQSGLDAYNAGDYRKALKEWREVASDPSSEPNPATYAETCYAIAMLYWQGEGVRQSYSKAYDWLLKAEELDHAGAQTKLGYLYTDGVTVPQDFSKAFSLYTKAARQGDVDGQYNLGIFYYYGWGTEQDKTMAAQYLAAASAQGDQPAEEALLRVLVEIEDENLQTRAQTREFVDADLSDDSTILPGSWIMSRNPEHYTIQVIALSSRDKLESLVEGHGDLAPFAIYQVARDGRALNVLLQGNYPDVHAARRARDYFPQSIQKIDQLWIRQFGMVQDQVRQ